MKFIEEVNTCSCTNGSQIISASLVQNSISITKHDRCEFFARVNISWQFGKVISKFELFVKKKVGFVNFKKMMDLLLTILLFFPNIKRMVFKDWSSSCGTIFMQPP